MGFQSKHGDVREALLCLGMAQASRVFLYWWRLELWGKMILFQYHLLGRERSSCKAVVCKDWETLTNRVESCLKEKERKDSTEKFGEWNTEDHLRGEKSQHPLRWSWLRGETCPFHPGRWAATLLRMGLLWSHGLISPDTSTNKGHIFLIKKSVESVLSIWNSHDLGKKGICPYSTTQDPPNKQWIFPSSVWQYLSCPGSWIKPKCLGFWKICWRGVYTLLTRRYLGMGKALQ